MTTPPPVILIVEDDHEFRLQLAEALRLEGYQVRTVSTGEEAVQALGEVPAPDLVALDLGLPRMSGAEFLRIKSQYFRWARIPVVVISGDVAAIGAAPAQAHVPKPVDWEALMRAIRQHAPIVGGDAPVEAPG